LDELIRDDEAAGDEGLEIDVERLKDLASEAPVIRLVSHLIANAVEQRASDVHIEALEHGLRARYRIDGVLHEIEPPPSRFRAAIVSRIKIMARLNIAERRLPQDGRIKLAVRGTPIDLRVSTIPTMYGEGVVMRVLDRQGVALDFATLGIAGRNLETYQEILDQPNGVFLVTGPTGSGKTTTLYAALTRLNSPEKKILTVEDPIEYHLEGINQIQVQPSIGLSFAHVLRSILRQDPDIIMIGEIRDVETARIAIQAALTGHLVLSTLHTNDAPSAITRLLDMGVEDYLLTSTLTGVAAQRLVRTLCPHCRVAAPALPELVEQLGLRRFATEPEIMVYRPKGCAQCNDSGYYGRTGLIETLQITDSIRRLILRRVEAMELMRAAIDEGMQTMYDDGIRKALAGETTIEEVLRVTRDV
jgi:general secretion pathway protein E